ncbi:MAG: hypothetical protein VX975_02675, partial [Acidobacteriota bacterium]|nr:hypothetical protein [Acidobacteriota bacterium]
ADRFSGVVLMLRPASARRDEGAYRQHSTEEQSAVATASARPGHSPAMNGPGGGWRRQAGCPARKMFANF